MRWFYNLRIAAKLIIGFLFVAMISGVVGIIGLVNLSNINEADNMLYEENTLGIDYAGNSSIYYQRIRFNSVKMILEEDASQNDIYINKIKKKLF